MRVAYRNRVWNRVGQALAAALALGYAAGLPAMSLDELYTGITSPFAAIARENIPPVQIDIDPDFGNGAEYDEFVILVGPAAVSIRANTRAAALYAADSLAQRLARSDGRLTAGQQRERAALSVRALHLMMRKMTPARLQGLIDKARLARMNTLLLYVGDDVAFAAAGITPLPNAMSPADFAAAVAYARASGMQVVPHLPLLTKQHRFFKQDAPELMFNNATYDPRNPETMRRVYAHLQEIIELIQPTVIHIGHDEVEGAFPRKARAKWSATQRRKWPRAGEAMLPPELFLQHVRDIRAFLARQSIRTWMWGDMLIRYDEFPGMVRRNMHGNKGYAELREQLPRDIVICDWHYWDEGTDFPTAAAFAAAGHEVLGSTRERPANIAAFSRYVAGMEQGGKGMIATLWSLVNRAEPELVDRVIAQSGQAFWNPDAAQR